MALMEKPKDIEDVYYATLNCQIISRWGYTTWKNDIPDGITQDSCDDNTVLIYKDTDQIQKLIETLSEFLVNSDYTSMPITHPELKDGIFEVRITDEFGDTHDDYFTIDNNVEDLYFS